MPAPKCPFQAPIITKEFACHLGQAVTARNTPQIHCQSDDALALCNQLNEKMKAVGLPAFDMEDDLATTPHNIYLKIQCGGLLELQKRSSIAVEQEGKIPDIRELVRQATRDGAGIDDIPYQDLAGAMQAYRSKRRRSRRA